MTGENNHPNRSKTITIEIKARFTGDVLYAAKIPADTESGLQMRVALEKAVTDKVQLRRAYLGGAYLGRAYLRRADLRGADLRGAYLGGADLGGADLGGADLRGADLGGADLGGAYLGDGTTTVQEATPEQAIANLDKVREIILDNKALLEMGHWHDGNSEWENHTCAEEAVCGTTHCLAGWLQVCSTDPVIRKMEANVAGIVCAPVASKMFFRDGDEVIDWLEKRKYVEESVAE